jgi:hypothetical protein
MKPVRQLREDGRQRHACIEPRRLSIGQAFGSRLMPNGEKVRRIRANSPYSKRLP